MPESLIARVHEIVSEIKLEMHCAVVIGHDDENTPGRHYLQIECYRKDVITGEMGFGRGGKFWLSEHMTQNEIIQGIFGLYLAYWTHEAREGFTWRGRRIFGPHISSEALWEVAPRVDVRSVKHVEDRPVTKGALVRRIGPSPDAPELLREELGLGIPSSRAPED